MAPRQKNNARKRSSPPPVVLSDEQEEQIKLAFEAIDTRNTGSIRAKQAKRAMQSLGVTATRDEIRAACVSCDHDDNKLMMDYATFVQMAGSKLGQRDKALKAFHLMDKDDKGVVCFEDLQRIAKELGESMNDDELLEMLEDADKSGQGFLVQEDFLNMAQGLNL